MNFIKQLILYKTIWISLLINVIYASYLQDKYKFIPIEENPEDTLDKNKKLILNSDKLSNCSKGAYMLSNNNCYYSEYFKINDQWYVFDGKISVKDLIADPKDDFYICHNNTECITNKCEYNICQVNQNSPNLFCSNIDLQNELFLYKSTETYNCYNITGQDITNNNNNNNNNNNYIKEKQENNKKEKNSTSLTNLIIFVGAFFFCCGIYVYLIWFYNKRYIIDNEPAGNDINVDNADNHDRQNRNNRNDENGYNSDDSEATIYIHNH